MALLYSALILAVAAFLQTTTAGSALRDGKFCENLSVIGGQRVGIEEVPYMAALIEKGRLRCGGSIVNTQFVLTAASCIGGEEATRKVLVGADHLNSSGYLMDVVKTICHKDYDEKTHTNDICLLKLEFDVPLERKVGVIALPSEDYSIGLFNVTGWGLTTMSNVNTKNTLRQTTIPFVSKECCNEMYNGEVVIQDTQICAGSYGHDACMGDSGGPLTNNGLQVGIASFGEGCGDKPGVYTKLAGYRTWIDTTIAINQ